MTEMLERVAEALYMEGCRRAIRVGIMKVDGVAKWADLTESSRRDYRDSADAALAAMRLATDSMIEAGNVTIYGDDFTCGINHFGNDDSGWTSLVCWERMIDAARGVD